MDYRIRGATRNNGQEVELIVQAQDADLLPKI